MLNTPGARDLRLVSPLVLLLLVEAVVVLCLAAKLEVGHTTAGGARARCELSQIGISCENCLFGLFFLWVYMRLDGSKCSECLPVVIFQISRL